MNKEDLQSYCNDLSKWISELGLEDELKVAFPKGNFPLNVNDEDELEEWADILVYLTLWMSIKANIRAPHYLESRMVFCDKVKGPWRQLYSKLLLKLEEGSRVSSINDLWLLAG